MTWSFPYQDKYLSQRKKLFVVVFIEASKHHYRDRGLSKLTLTTTATLPAIDLRVSVT